MSNFIPLHIISGYSFLKSGLSIDRIERGVVKNAFFGAGLTDYSSMHGFPAFSEMMTKNSKPYILGTLLELDYGNICLYIKNENGYKNLLKINSLIQKDEELTLDLLKEHSEDLIAVIEAKYGAFKDNFLEMDENTFSRYLVTISSCFKDFYIGLENTSKADVQYSNKIRLFADKHTYECVAFPRIEYLKKEDAIVIDIVRAIDEGTELEEKKKDGFNYFLSAKDYPKIYTKKEIENTEKILSSASFVCESKRGEMMNYSNDNPKETLRDICKKSLISLEINDEEHNKRLDYELDVIDNLGYSDYFLIVYEYVNWAKNNDVLVGPGRGSAAGSLVAYLLNITELDPLKYGLQFERFLNPNRKSMPDIDVDFVDIKREQVIEHLRERYGNDKVATIGTFQTIKARQALRDIARVYKFPERHVVLISKLLPSNNSTLAEAYKTSEEFKKLIDSDEYFKEFVSLAAKIENLPRQAGQHASGVVLNKSSLCEALPVSYDFNNHLTTQYEAKYLEEQGFLKMDFLGLRNLYLVDYCVDLINKNHPEVKLNKQAIPYDFKEVYELISSLKVAGLFQIETEAMKRAIRIIKPKCFDDVVALLALNRPGPMKFMQEYADRRDGKKVPTYDSEELKEVLSSTYGIIIYQEQVNQIATVMGGFSLADADIFRRAISKKEIKLIESMKEDFYKGASKKGYKKEVIDKIYKQIELFADYGFNKSHAAVYALLTLKMAYLKWKYPLEFYVSLLETSSIKDNKVNEYIIEMKKMGLTIKNPSINLSSNTYTINSDSIILPLTNISKIDAVLASKIIEERNKGKFIDLFDFVLRTHALKLSEDQYNNLVDAGALDDFGLNRNTLRANLKKAIQYAELSFDKDGSVLLGLGLPKPSVTQIGEDLMDNLDKEFKVLGIVLSASLLKAKEEIIKENNALSISEIKERNKGTVAGIIESVKIIKTKQKENMAFVTLKDDFDLLEVTVFPRTYTIVKDLLVERKIVLVKGLIAKKKEQTSLVCDDMKEI